MLKKIHLLLIFALSSTFFLHAQVTTSSITGKITDATSNGLRGATISAKHLPSGTVYNTVSNETGNFNIQGMRTGGPYTVEISYVGLETKTISDISLTLGEPYVLNETLGDNGKSLQEVVIQTAGKSPILNNQRTGAATSISTQQLNTLPTIKRSLNDFIRLTPQSNGSNFAGRDGRYNSIQVDGATFNNSFGLSSDLLPGGAAQPISLDALDAVQVNIAPYDVRQSGFTGAGVNAVTRSGTNDFHGSVYGFFRNNMSGGKVGDAELSDLATKNKYISYGARLGGPIIKDKLFFFANYEHEKYTYPGNTWLATRPGVSGSNVARTTAEDLDAVRNLLISKYGYDPGAYENYANNYSNESNKFLIKLDWNINTKNKFTIRYNQVIGTEDQGANGNSGPNPRSTTNRISSNSIVFANANYAFKNTIRSLTGELNSSINNKLSNQFLATYTYIRSTRSTPGNLFPFVDIWDGYVTKGSKGQDSTVMGTNNYMSFGTELFSYHNDVKNTNTSFTDNLTYLAGKHTLTGGISFQTMSFANNYMREGTSYYRYNTVADFLNDAPPTAFAITYPYAGNDGYARVKFGQAGVYLQDRFAASEKVSLTYGLRADMPIFLDKPVKNDAISALELLDKNGNPTHYSTDWPKSSVLLSPRIGINWDVFGNRSLQVRGGTGIFTGLLPFVWFTNVPTNSGILQNTVEPVNAATLAQINHFEKDPLYWVNQLEYNANTKVGFPSSPSSGAPSSIAVVDKDFKMPQVWRTNLGADYRIPGTPLIATVDLMYTKDINGIYQFNANYKPATKTMTYAGDARDYYTTSADAIYNTSTGSVTAVLSNTKKGYSYNATVGLTLPSRKGFYGSIFYTYTNSRDISGNPGSAANSAWSNNYFINSPNEETMGYSQFAIPHRLVGSISYRLEYANHLASTFSLFYQGQNAGRFAWTYNGQINNNGVTGALLYVPQNASDIQFADLKDKQGNVLFTAQQQQEAFEAFINNNKSLKDAKGSVVLRNSGTLPWLNRFDFKFLQDLFMNIGKSRNTLQFTVDILNIGNLLNSKWGIRQELNNGSLYNYNLLNVASKDANGVPTFNMITIQQNGQTVLPTSAFRNYADVSNTWSMQLGLRYTF